MFAKLKICKDMIRFGFIGTGRISDWVYKGASEDPRIRITAICSRTKEAAQAFIDRHPEIEGAKIYTSVADMAQDPEIDAVYIGTPNQTHHGYCLTLLNAGKHVLCEKPFSINAQEAREMAEAARKNKRLLMEAMISTFNPNFRAIVDRIEEIAPIRQYSSYFCQYSSKYEALKKGTVASCFQPRTAGSLRDIGIYTLYPLLSVFGRPNSIKADLTPYETPEGVTDIHGTMQLHYGEMTATLVFSKVCDSFQPTEIAGENGNLIIDEIRIARKAEIVYHIPPTSGLGPKAGRTLIHEGLEHDAYYYEMKEFADLVEAGETESKINSLDTSIIAMEIIDEALEQNGLC